MAREVRAPPTTALWLLEAEPSGTPTSVSPCLNSSDFTGANSIESAPTGRVTDFVKSNGGHTVITKVSST